MKIGEMLFTAQRKPPPRKAGRAAGEVQKMEYKAEELAEKAVQARQNAYCPYSGFAVGAALLGASGRVYTGCNVENASYGLSLCAERGAVMQALAAGERRFVALAVAGGGQAGLEAGVTPCGACRQVLCEFCGQDFPVILVNPGETLENHSLGELLPLAFALE